MADVLFCLRESVPFGALVFASLSAVVPSKCRKRRIQRVNSQMIEETGRTENRPPSSSLSLSSSPILLVDEARDRPPLLLFFSRRTLSRCWESSVESVGDVVTVVEDEVDADVDEDEADDEADDEDDADEPKELAKDELEAEEGEGLELVLLLVGGVTTLMTMPVSLPSSALFTTEVVSHGISRRLERRLSSVLPERKRHVSAKSGEHKKRRNLSWCCCSVRCCCYRCFRCYCLSS
jgi:hypothetical protein